jgi:hypothetical protein
MTIEARRIDHNTYDLFIGTQWSDWIRVRRGRNGTYRLVGIRVPKAVLHWLNDVLAPNMPINYGQDIECMLHNINAINATR